MPALAAHNFQENSVFFISILQLQKIWSVSVVEQQGKLGPPFPYESHPSCGNKHLPHLSHDAIMGNCSHFSCNHIHTQLPSSEEIQPPVPQSICPIRKLSRCRSLHGSCRNPPIPLQHGSCIVVGKLSIQDNQFFTISTSVENQHHQNDKVSRLDVCDWCSHQRATAWP